MIDMVIILSVNFFPCKITYQFENLCYQRKGTKEGLSTLKFIKLKKRNFEICFFIIIKFEEFIDLPTCLFFDLTNFWLDILFSMEKNLQIKSSIIWSGCCMDLTLDLYSELLPWFEHRKQYPVTIQNKFVTPVKLYGSKNQMVQQWNLFGLTELFVSCIAIKSFR